MFNKVILIGRLGKNAEVKIAQNKKDYVVLSIATSESWKNDRGEYETLAHNPEMLIAPSNIYWASKTTIPAIQHLAARDWADLWAIPLYEASNR